MHAGPRRNPTCKCEGGKPDCQACYVSQIGLSNHQGGTCCMQSVSVTALFSFKYEHTKFRPWDRKRKQENKGLQAISALSSRAMCTEMVSQIEVAPSPVCNIAKRHKIILSTDLLASIQIWIPCMREPYTSITKSSCQDNESNLG